MEFRSVGDEVSAADLDEIFPCEMVAGKTRTSDGRCWQITRYVETVDVKFGRRRRFVVLRARQTSAVGADEANRMATQFARTHTAGRKAGRMC